MSTLRSSVIERKPITDALIAMLAAGTGKPCGDHDIPPGASLVEGYSIVYTVDGGSYEGAPLWAPESDAILVYQVSSVGSLRSQAEWIADRVRRTLCSRVPKGGFQVTFPDPAGFRVTSRWPESTVPAPIVTGATAKDRIFTVPERFHLAVEAT